MKAVMLGLDGLSPQILTNALKKAELPNLQRIISNGEVHTLVSIPPVTPIEWTSIATGMNPAKHGIWGFTKI
ncbi:MAG: alkaline phosphatase family protein, partial [Caldisphaeraceae archaeon]|nr:alkaline phosphatase family protein [Caldisphaeraceae archaeon]